MFFEAMKSHNRPIEFPVSNTDVLLFIEWLVNTRKVMSATISHYLAGLRQLHVSKGIDPPVIRSDFVKQILRGKLNADNIVKRSTPQAKRMPVTIAVMQLMKELIRTCDKSLINKCLLWSVCTLAFAGSFRVHELLCRSSTTFDPDFDLLCEDVSAHHAPSPTARPFLSVLLKCPKENRQVNRRLSMFSHQKGNFAQ